MWIVPAGLGFVARSWVLACIQAWDCSQVCGWHHKANFPPFFYLFCWLSWKVSPFWSTLYQFTNILYRIILATIRYLWGCPCPCCFIRKDQISALGTKADDQWRSHLRTDTEDQQYKVNKTWTWIFNNGQGVNSKWVEDLLQADSWIPTLVCALISQLFFTYWFW